MKKLLLLSCLSLALFTRLEAKDIESSIGIVNFKVCVEKSKIGKAEQSAFEALKDQMVSVLEKTEKELEDIANKLGDEDHLESLSQEGQNDLKSKFQMLNQELARYQNQYYQILNQANFKLISELNGKVADAAASVAKNKNLALILNDEATFYKLPSLEVTNEVIVELDKRFDADEKEAQKATTPPAKS